MFKEPFKFEPNKIENAYLKHVYSVVYKKSLARYIKDKNFYKHLKANAFPKQFLAKQRVRKLEYLDVAGERLNLLRKMHSF